MGYVDKPHETFLLFGKNNKGLFPPADELVAKANDKRLMKRKAPKRKRNK